MATGLSNASGLSATSSSLTLRALNSGLAYRGGASASDSANSWEAAVIANGGTVSPARKTIVQNFITAEIAAGTWALTDDYWPLWAENAVQSLTSLKQQRLATAVAAPTFVANRGYTFDGATNYVNTGFVASTHTTTMTPSNMRIAGYERTDVNANTYTAGVAATGTVVMQFRTRSTTSCFGNLNSASVTYTLPTATSIGYTAFSRNGPDASTCFGYKNGVAMVQGSSTTFVSATLPFLAIFIGCQSSLGTAANFRATSVGFLTIGAQLSAAQELAHYNNVQTWALAIGAVTDDVDAQSWMDQVVTNGGTVSAARLKIVADFIKAEKSAGTWALTDDYWPLWGENSQQALTSLKQRRLATATVPPTFTADRGYVFNGSTQFLDTGFVPSTHGIAMTGTNQRIAVYERTNVSAGNVTAGVVPVSGTLPGILVGARSGANTLTRINSGANLSYTLPVADSRGYTSASLNGTTLADHKNFKNSVELIYAAGTFTSFTTLAAISLYIGGTNVNSVFSNPRACSVGIVAIGASLSSAQETAQYNNVQAWATSIGANV